MGVFAANTIYDHMRNQHGTIHDDDPVDNHANVRDVWLHGLGPEEVLREERGFEDEAFQERQRRNELIMAAARHDATVRRDAAARQDAAAARRIEIARRAEVARRQQEVATRQMEDATRQRVRYYQETMRQRRLEEERERARAQEERPGWGCTIM
jgi:hypothetical protein